MTILYQSDWEKYPTAIPDLESANISWVTQCAKYEQMGVKHWYFPLALYQPHLQGVDPHSDGLDEDTKVAILLECAYNPWYAIREVIRIPATSGGGSNRLDANRGNIAMFWCVLNSFITYVQQIRQTGKTLNSRVIVILFHHFMAMGSQHILFTKGDLRKDEIKAYKLMRTLLPAWMWTLTKGDTDNQYEFTTASRGNVTKSYVPQGDPETANSVGRGTTPTLVLGDEVPFLPYAEISIPALIAATTASFDEAKRKGMMHAILYTTTAGDLSTNSGRYVYDMIKKPAMYFSEILFDSLDREDAVRTILANSKNSVPCVDISFNHLQLGKSDEWLREKIASTPAKRDQIKRDYLGQWTFGSTRNPINERLLNRMRDTINEWPIIIKDPKQGYTVRYHKPVEYVKSRTSVLGLDTSNAVGRDAITGVMIDAETSEVLATFMVGEASLARFGHWLAIFIKDHPLMTIIPEAKSSWHGIMDSLLIDLPAMGIDPGRRIYHRCVDEKEGSDSDRRLYREYSQGIPTERKYFPFRNTFGFPTSGPLREDLYGIILKEATDSSSALVRDSVLVDELASLVERNNRIDHKASGHDDHVISWLMAHWFLRVARNLDHYGIDTRKVLSRVRAESLGDNPKEYARNQKEEKLILEIEAWEQKLENASTLMEQKYLMARIASLKSNQRLGDVSEDTFSADKASDAARLKKTAERMAQTVSQTKEGLFKGGLKFHIRPR